MAMSTTKRKFMASGVAVSQLCQLFLDGEKSRRCSKRAGNRTALLIRLRVAD